MKTSKFLGFAAVMALFSLSACEGFAPTIKVPVSSENEFVLQQPSKALAEKVVLAKLDQWDFNEDINKLITDNGGDPEKVKEGNVTEVTVSLKTQSSIDLTTIFTDLELRVDKKPATKEELVAKLKSVTATSVTFEIIKKDIYEYLTGGGEFSFMLYGTVNPANIPVNGVELVTLVKSELVVEIL